VSAQVASVAHDSLKWSERATIWQPSIKIARQGCVSSPLTRKQKGFSFKLLTWSFRPATAVASTQRTTTSFENMLASLDYCYEKFFFLVVASFLS